MRRGIAHVPQGRRVFADTTVLGNLLVGAYTRKDKAGIQTDLEFFYGMFPILRERSGQAAGPCRAGSSRCSPCAGR